jgi:exodeoxyribonuclease VII large subunit
LRMQGIDGAAPDGKVYTVTELTSFLKGLVEGQFPSIWIVGEVSNCTAHSSGHTYFTLKDEGAQIRCVLFSGAARRVTARPEDGMKMYALGRLTVYERQGQYELIVSNLLPVGRGELYAAFARLKEKLAKEGLFDEARKKKLPRFPSRIAVVTSPTGAAVRDVIRVAGRIHAGVEIVVYPVRVQGEGAKEEIADAIGFLNTQTGFDVIILARGGGSIEDLWAFNEEMVARAVAASEIPVVSAVGHEIDFTIADFAADARVPTPSAAPTLVLADYVDAASRLEGLVNRAGTAVAGRIDRSVAFIESLKTHYGMRAMRDRVTAGMRDLDETVSGARKIVDGIIRSGQSRLAGLSGKLDALSPLSTLERGYSIVFLEDTGAVVKGAEQVDVGKRLRIRFFRGSALSRVESTEEAE